MNYWNECISEAFCEVGISATDEQIDEVADIVAGAHENYGMAHGHDCIPNPLETENKRLKAELIEEKEKVVCRTCHGHGRITSNGPVHS